MKTRKQESIPTDLLRSFLFNIEDQLMTVRELRRVLFQAELKKENDK